MDSGTRGNGDPAQGPSGWELDDAMLRRLTMPSRPTEAAGSLARTSATRARERRSLGRSEGVSYQISYLPEGLTSTALGASPDSADRLRWIASVSGLVWSRITLIADAQVLDQNGQFAVCSAAGHTHSRRSRIMPGSAGQLRAPAALACRTDGGQALIERLAPIALRWCQAGRSAKEVPVRIERAQSSKFECRRRRLHYDVAWPVDSVQPLDARTSVTSSSTVEPGRSAGRSTCVSANLSPCRSKTERSVTMVLTARPGAVPAPTSSTSRDRECFARRAARRRRTRCH